MEIKRFDSRPGCSRVVIHNNVAYFTGHVSPKSEDLVEQAVAVFARYDELFEQFGLKKENILMGNIYVDDLSRLPEFNEEYAKWVGTEHAPAGVAVEASPTGDYHIEIALIVAVE